MSRWVAAEGWAFAYQSYSRRYVAEAAYAHSDLFEKRRTLMELWSEYLAA